MGVTVLVCGGRDFSDSAWAYEILDAFKAKKGLDVLVQGGARGADQLASEWANDRGIPQKIYPADWQKHGKGAGPIRNQQMLDAEPIDFVVAFPGGSGTRDMITRAKAKGIKVLEVPVRGT
jgi:hypothetical protein